MCVSVFVVAVAVLVYVGCSCSRRCLGSRSCFVGVFCFSLSCLYL